MPEALRYIRRYVRHERNPFGGNARALFDCLTELWCASREDFGACASSLADPAAYARLYRDEENLFASHNNPLFSVDEVESIRTMAHAEVVPDVFKIVVLVRRNPRLTGPQFHELYETQYRPLETEAFRSAVKYVRRYVHPEINPVIGEPIAIPFDALVETWWASRSDWEEASKSIAAGEPGPALRDARQELFAATEQPCFSVVEFESAMQARCHTSPEP